MRCSSLTPVLEAAAEFDGLAWLSVGSFMGWRGRTSEFRTNAESASCMAFEIDSKWPKAAWAVTECNVASGGKVP